LLPAAYANKEVEQCRGWSSASALHLKDLLLFGFSR
jgi:hypothetical protein